MLILIVTHFLSTSVTLAMTYNIHLFTLNITGLFPYNKIALFCTSDIMYLCEKK